MDQIRDMLAVVGDLVKAFVVEVYSICEFVNQLTPKWYGALLVLAVLAIAFLIRGIIRSFAKNPKSTIFFVILFAAIAAGWYFIMK